MKSKVQPNALPMGTEKTSQTDDQRIKDITVLPPPEHLIRFFPIQGTKVEELITHTRRSIHRIMAREDDRLLVVMGPVTHAIEWIVGLFLRPFGFRSGARVGVISGSEDEFRRRPLIGFGVCPVSPLKLPRDATEVIIESARWWIPNNILSMAMSGGSSPVTLAGTLVTHNAEVLAGITLAQLTERGCPMMYGSSTTAMDLKLAAASVGSPEIAVISAAVAQMAKRYLIPSFVAGL